MVDNVLSPNTNVTPDTEASEYTWNPLSVAVEDLSSNDGLLEQSEEEELQFELPGRTDPEAVQYISGYVARKVCYVLCLDRFISNYFLTSARPYHKNTCGGLLHLSPVSGGRPGQGQ